MIESVVQKQLEAYNAKDLETFLDCYSDEIEVYDHPNTLIMSGKERMRNHYRNLFDSYPSMRCNLVNRMISGNIVIDHEQITGRTEGILEAIAIYEVIDERIQKVWFVR